MLRLTGLCVLLFLPSYDASAAGMRPPAGPAAAEVQENEERAVPPARFRASAAVEILHTWGEMLRRRDAGDRATTYYLLALRLAPEGSLAAARELAALGTVSRRRGDLPAAGELLRQAHAIHEKLAPGSAAYANTLSELAVMMALRGEMAAAKEQFQRVLELQQQLVPDSMEMAGTLIHLGILAQDRGNFALSEDFLRRAIALIERLRPDDLELARALSTLGRTQMMRGDLAVAEEHIRRALEIRQKLAPESVNVAGSLQNLGIIAEKRGELAAAEELHGRSLEIREKLTPGTPYVSESLANLGSIERRRGNLAKADEYYRRALEIDDRVAPNRLAGTLMRAERARVALERGDLALAEELYGFALSWLEERLPGTLDVADILDGQGRVAFERGDLPKALGLLERAVAINERMAPGSARLGIVLNGLGQVHRRAGRLDRAAEYFCRATEELDQQRKKLGGTKEGKSAFGRTTAQLYHDCLASLIATGRPADAFRSLERGRARAFLDLLAERDLTWTADLTPELAQEQKQVAAEYDRTQAALDHLSPVYSDVEVNRLLVRLRELRTQQEEIAAKIRRTSPRHAALNDPQPLDLAAARRVLDPGTLLLAWSVGRKHSFLFVVAPEAAPGPGLEVFEIPLGDQDLRRRVESFRDLLQSPDSDREALTAQAQELYDLLLGPAAPRIGVAERLLVSADGPLHILPFAALFWDGGFLVERKAIHTVISATVYAELKDARRERPPGSGLELAAFGAPSYPPVSPDSPVHPEVRVAIGRGLGLSPLPATRDEVRGIAALYPEAQAFLGDEATEERAKTIGQDARYLHFACHGLLDERFPLSSALALSIPTRPRDGEDNGLLQAWEIFESVRLDADLVTLSACDSALGSEMGGEGLLGLTRAFQYAGARSVLASLWGVSDVSTSDLMKRFYSHLRAGESKDEALRSAQVAAIGSAKYSHPYYWAAFQLAGDWK